MQGASPLASPGLNPRGTGKGGEPRTRRGARLLCRLPALPFAFLSAPLPRRGRISPQPPSPVGKGDQGYFMQGASPLASPGQNPRGTGKGGEPRTRRGACPRRCRLTLPLWYSQGGLSFWSPAYTAFSFDSAPYPPCPLPRRGRGRFKVISCKGLRPLHPRGAEPGRRWDEASPAPGGACPRRCRLTLPLWYPQGGAPSLSPADPAFCFPFCPLPRRGKIDPRGRGARTCAAGKSARTGVCVAGRTCNNRHPLLTIAAEYGTITHRKNPKRGGKR